MSPSAQRWVVLSEYKNRHPDDTDEPQDVGLSSDDEATGMEEQIGIARRITLSGPSPVGPHATPGRPSATAGTAGPSDPPTGPPVGFVKLGPDEVVISKGVLWGIKRGAELALKGTLPTLMLPNCQSMPSTATFVKRTFLHPKH